MGDLILQDNKYTRPNISSTKKVSWNPSYFLDSYEDKPHLRSSPELSSRGLGNKLKGVCPCLLAAGRRFSHIQRLRKKQQLALQSSQAGFCSAVCVEVPSETEAVQGTHMKLLCISCMKREEVTASTVVEWFYRPEGGKDEPIYEYRKTNHEFPSRFSGRLQWNGSKDMQDVSITVLNVTLNDSGIYTCNITREFEFEIHRPLFTSSRLIHLTVVEEAGEDFTSVISEIMMYILLVFLTLWLLIEMVYCYRKVSKAEEAAQENATDYLAIPSENKENCAVPVEE
ncbi:sodium channel subunit beta-3 isoform X2 [Phalacrocorax carbo]|uniref:sodium channel subunit beta-3 isoform X2 n=1 Tax=Phalacrocorax carbo TaxID=9209 RepID=UPI00311A0E04